MTSLDLMNRPEVEAHRSNGVPVDCGRKAFFVAAGTILAITALAKFITIYHGSKSLVLPDPVFSFLSNRHLLMIGASIELGGVMALLAAMRNSDKLLLLLWFCLLFWSYRLGLRLVDFRGYCPCLGTASDWLPIPPKTLDLVIKSCLCFLTAGALGLLIWEWKQTSGALLRLRRPPGSQL